MSYLEVSRLNEEQARTLLESIVWPDGPVCPKCGNCEVATIVHLSARPGLRRCKPCRAQFTATVGTIFERSHIPLSKWMQAIYKMCSSKKGISALQLKRELWGEHKGSYETAWFMAHRIREAMKDTGFRLGSKGQTIEADEAYIGGHIRGRSHRMQNKTMLMGLVERGKHGRARSFPIADVSGATLSKALMENTNNKSTLNTDEWLGYSGASGLYQGGHETVNHSADEYVRKSTKNGMGRPHVVTTNSVESFWALLKRGIHGSFHSVSRKHLHRYANEFAFRWSNRTIPDSERAVQTIRGARGRRLTYA